MNVYMEDNRKATRPLTFGLRRQRARSHLNLHETVDQDYINNPQNAIPLDQLSDSLSYHAAETNPERMLQPESGPQPCYHLDASAGSQETLNHPSPARERSGTDKTKFARLTPADSVVRYLLWPAITICLPILLISTSILWIISFYRVKLTDDIFATGPSQHVRYSSYILVDFSATKLVFLASFLSTLAPLLAGCIMSLGSVLVYHKLQGISGITHFDKLPTAYQLSLLIGLLSASYDQLLTTCRYMMHRNRAKAAPVLLYAFWLLVLSIVLGLAVTATDAVLHIKTQTIDVTLYSDSPGVPSSQLGRGLSAYCLQLDRFKYNDGFACSFGAEANTSSQPNYLEPKPDTQRLAHNNSLISQIRHVRSSDNDRPVAILLPAVTSIPVAMNFDASTLGVASQCRLVPHRLCNTSTWGISNVSTTFNCSSKFRGVLGTPPVESSITNPKGKTLDPDLSFLAIKQNAQLIYNYFTDNTWTTVYNPADLNARGVQNANFTPWPDSQLSNPVTVLFAIRTASASFQGGSKNAMAMSDKIVRSPYGWIDLFMSCEVATHDVNYTWVNGGTRNVTTNIHNNGSVLHVWTSIAPHVPRLTTMDADLLDYVVQSTVDSSSTGDFENKFAKLLSEKALSTIGAYSTPRRAVREQSYSTRLVAKVPTSALGSLLACSLLYPILGLILVLKAWRAARGNGPITPLFSYWGLTSTAFLDGDEFGEVEMDDCKTADSEDARRLFIRSGQTQGNRFGIWRRSTTGEYSELTPARTRGEVWV